VVERKNHNLRAGSSILPSATMSSGGGAIPHSINLTMTARDWAMLLALSILWGASFPFVAVAVAELPPLTITVVRLGLAALILAAVMASQGVSVPRGAWRPLGVMGLINNALPLTLIAYAISLVPSGVAAIFNATVPLFAVLVAHLCTDDEKLTAERVAGVVIGFAGVVVMSGGSSDDWIAQAALMTAAWLYAMAAVYGRRFKVMGVPPMATATGMLTTSTVMLLPVALVVDQPWTLPMPSVAVISSLLGLALLATALAFILYFKILASAGATNLLLVTFLIPVSAVIFGVGLLGEQLQAKHITGIALIGLGLATIDGRLIAYVYHRVLRSRS
jgi:drug/metabolite transporter (DMT)-like permease